MLRAGQFSHVVFPRQQKRRRSVDLGPPNAKSRRTATPIAPPLDEASARFVAWLFGRAGIDWRSYRPEPLRRRLPACLRALRVRSVAGFFEPGSVTTRATTGVTDPGYREFDAARRRIELYPSALPVALSAMLLGVTELFRDWQVFEQIGRDLSADVSRSRASIRVWSAGCSSGAELYSMAILLSEHGLLEQSTLCGTDCRQDALASAAEGRFLPPAVEQLPRMYRRYFESSGQSWQACRRLRDKLKWQLADITQLNDLGSWDVIFCRNVAMYFEQGTAHALFRRIENALRPGGLLVLGRAERPCPTQRLSLVGPCIYRRGRVGT